MFEEVIKKVEETFGPDAAEVLRTAISAVQSTGPSLRKPFRFPAVTEDGRFIRIPEEVRTLLNVKPGDVFIITIEDHFVREPSKEEER